MPRAHVYVHLDEYNITINLDMTKPFTFRVEYSDYNSQWELRMYPNQTDEDKPWDCLFAASTENECQEAYKNFVAFINTVQRD